METSSVIMGAILGILIATLLNAFILWIVGKLGLGIEIDGFGAAFVGAFVAAVLGFGLEYITRSWSGSFWGDNAGTFLHVIGTAFVLLLTGSLVSGMRTKGFFGAIIAAIAIGLTYWFLVKLLM
jgi:putative membrane protein